MTTNRLSRLGLAFAGALLLAPTLVLAQDSTFDRPADRLERSGRQTFEFSLDTGVTGSIADAYADPVQTMTEIEDRVSRAPDPLRLPTPRDR